MLFEDFLAKNGEIVKEAAALASIERYGLEPRAFAVALFASMERYAAEGAKLRDFLLSLRLEDLALATACGRGIETAWEEFHRTYRQYLVDIAGECDLADQVIAELYGAERQPGHIVHFRGRSSLKGWLRAIVFQAQVDRHRQDHRLTELETLAVEPAHEEHPEDFERRENATALARALRSEVDKLTPEQRLLLAWYYLDQLRLAQIARLRGIHESTVSRELDAIRKTLRKRVEK